MQPVECTLKVQGKSLTTVLDEFHFIVNLYSFPLPLVPHANPSFLKVSHLTPSRQNNFQNSFFGDNSLPPLSFKISFTDTSFPISTNSLQGFIPLSRMLVGFCLKLSYSIMCGKIFQIYGNHIPGKCIDLRHFYLCPSPFKSYHHVLIITPQAEGKILIPSGRILSIICFPQQQKGEEEIMICFYQNSVRQYEGDLEHQVFYILSDLQFFQM